MSEVGEGLWSSALLPSGEQVELWTGAGTIANEHGDLYGTTPRQLIRTGLVSIDESRFRAALAYGWKFVPGADPGFARLRRDWEDRPR